MMIEKEYRQMDRPFPDDIEEHKAALLDLFAAVRQVPDLNPVKLNRLMAQHVPLRKDRVVEAYRQFTAHGVIPFERSVFDSLRLNPIRTLSGVAPVAVLTGPYPCPADCIFCPEAKGLPRSYLPEEPGAQRGRLARFDPYRQTALRLAALEQEGHPTQKVELLVLGATWSAYPRKYQEWFLRRCLDALNGVESQALVQAQQVNETAEHRSVGLVVETRPDYIDMAEVQRLRYLGVTKVQMGLQSLDDSILAANRRGHTVEQSRRAMRLLRLAGFKLHVHWMPNLLGATPESDRQDFARLWSDPAFRPDELKVYPCNLIRGTELYQYWQQGDYRPYTDDELLELLIACKSIVPRYCRINRVMRDIPAQYVAAGSTTSHLRQIVQREMKNRGLRCECIRCREVRSQALRAEDLRLETLFYETDATIEYFLSYVAAGDRLAGFCRLSLPFAHVPPEEVLEELLGSAVIREVHVYGPALELGMPSAGQAQHVGLGARLIEHARGIAAEAGFKRIAVISAIGTREYYRRLGFTLGELYMTRATD
jgi:elongator complex protein 3